MQERICVLEPSEVGKTEKSSQPMSVAVATATKHVVSSFAANCQKTSCDLMCLDKQGLTSPHWT